MDTKQRIAAVVKCDRLWALLNETGLCLPEKAVRKLSKDFDVLFKGCATHQDKINRVKEIQQRHIKNLICSMVKKSPDLNWSTEYIDELAKNWENYFPGCKKDADFIDRMQEIALTLFMADLIKEAGLNWPLEYAENLTSDYEHYFHDCDTRDEAIQRLQDLAPVITFS